MVEWLPIAQYDALPASRRPARAVFFFAASPHEDSRRSYAGIPSMVSVERVRGNREATHFIALPADPQ